MLSRRKFLAIGATGLLVAGFGASLPSIRKYLSQVISVRHIKGIVSNAPLNSTLSNTLVSFIGAMFGEDFVRQDHYELSELVTFAASADNGWVAEYRWLATYIDNMAKKTGAESFSSASPELRESIMLNIMSRPASSFKSRLLAMTSEPELLRRRMQFTTIPHLRRIYLASGVPWRKRGYQSWPGVPGDPREYTRQGPVRQC